MTPPRRSFGTLADAHDPRDLEYAVPGHVRRRLPRRVDLRPGFPAVYEQGSLNSCSANALAAAMWYDERREGSPRAASPSRLFIYYNERASEHVVSRNACVSLRDGYRTVRLVGACPEGLWPYREPRFADRPPPRCYARAHVFRVTAYHRVRRELSQLRGCLAEGYPWTLALALHASFRSARVRRTGAVPMPARHDRLLGGHAMLAVGYDDSKECFIVRNSWGARWGLGGHCLVPYAYLMDPRLSWDFWTATHVSSAARRGRARRSLA